MDDFERTSRNVEVILCNFSESKSRTHKTNSFDISKNKDQKIKLDSNSNIVMALWLTYESDDRI